MDSYRIGGYDIFPGSSVGRDGDTDLYYGVSGQLELFPGWTDSNGRGIRDHGHVVINPAGDLKYWRHVDGSVVYNDRWG